MELSEWARLEGHEKLRSVEKWEEENLLTDLTDLILDALVPM